MGTQCEVAASLERGRERAALSIFACVLEGREVQVVRRKVNVAETHRSLNSAFLQRVETVQDVICVGAGAVR